MNTTAKLKAVSPRFHGTAPGPGTASGSLPATFNFARSWSPSKLSASMRSVSASMSPEPEIGVSHAHDFSDSLPAIPSKMEGGTNQHSNGGHAHVLHSMASMLHQYKAAIAKSFNSEQRAIAIQDRRVIDTDGPTLPQWEAVESILAKLPAHETTQLLKEAHQTLQELARLAEVASVEVSVPVACTDMKPNGFADLRGRKVRRESAGVTSDGAAIRGLTPGHHQPTAVLPFPLFAAVDSVLNLTDPSQTALINFMNGKSPDASLRSVSRFSYVERRSTCQMQLPMMQDFPPSISTCCWRKSAEACSGRCTLR